MTALGPLQQRLAGRLSGGMKQKLGLACTLVRSPELAAARRADGRRRSAVAPGIVGDHPAAGARARASPCCSARPISTKPSVATRFLCCARESCWRSGRPEDVTAVAKGHSFEVDTAGRRAGRGICRRGCLTIPKSWMPCPKAASVRLRASAGAEPDRWLSAIGRRRRCRRVSKTASWSLLRQQSSRRPRPSASAASPVKPPRAAQSRMSSKCEIWSANSAPSPRSITSVSKSSAARSSDCSVPTAPAKPRLFACSAGCCRPTGGTLRVAGLDLRQARASARQRIGYVAQKFSLYGQLTVAENLDFFASAYGLHGARKRERIDWALAQFELEPLMQLPSGQLPGGYKQRLAMAAALLHDAGNSVSRRTDQRRRPAGPPRILAAHHCTWREQQ